MSSRPQFARLALVSKVLCDREAIELRKENERLYQENQVLKLTVFWRDHNISMLNEAMVLVVEYGMRNMWIRPILQACGLEVGILGGLLPYSGSAQSDLDTHLVSTSRYTFVAYGTKLWKAKSFDDPELRKLKALFDTLADKRRTGGHV
jgi:hypothetical protein